MYMYRLTSALPACTYTHVHCIVEHKPEMKEDDPKALFSQQIPKSFFNLQEDIRKLLVDYKEKQLPPILEEEAFRKEFRKKFEDDEEMTEAVYYLTLQGIYLTLRHQKVVSLCMSLANRNT